MAMSHVLTGGVRIEELDELKRKMNAKLAEAENELDAARSKIAQLEKAKTRLTGDLEDMSIEMERVNMIFKIYQHKCISKNR